LRIAARESLVIVEDDVHRLLVTRPPPPLAALDPERVVYVTSVSKILAGGLRVGYLTAPRVHRGRVQDALWATTWSTANLTAELVAHWQTDGTLASAVRARRKEARARVRLALASLAGFDVAAHPESFHLWWRLPKGWPQARFVTEALRVGVAVSGADAFCVATGGAVVEDAVRLSLSGPQTQAMLSDGLSRLVRLATEPPERMRM
jgi:DNA-binding transcriptional MocR family regulator